MMKFSVLFSWLLVFGFLYTGSAAFAGTITVGSLQPTIVAGNGWGKNVVGGGSVDIVDLSGAGGNLETNQPLPTGAVRVQTGASNADRAEIGIEQDFGDAQDLFSSLSAGYSFFKVNQGNLAAAPALKIAVYSATAGADPDRYGQLIYEPYFNNGSANPTTGVWQDEIITQDNGLWWWTGGFSIAGSGGGPPLKTLAQWNTDLSANTSFNDARVIGLGLGVGTYNQSQDGYFDSVSFNGTTYNFQTAATVPEPASMLTFAGLGLCALGMRRKRRRA